MAKVINETKGRAVVTPRGSASWVKIKDPDTTFDSDGIFSANIVLDPEASDVQKFISNMEKLRDQAFEEAKRNLAPAKAKSLAVKDVFHEEMDKEGNETGKIFLKTKTKAKGVDRDGNEYNVTIPVFDEKGIEQKDWNLLIGNGSVIKLQVWANPYYMANGNFVGITLKLKKIQIIDLIKYEAGGESFTDESGDGFEDTSETFEDSDGDF